ncbi:MAG: cupin domain-containing protein [Bacteroidetes bacterium]|nr:cupin domain-containing protein [Bacteroidota bacterium]
MSQNTEAIFPHGEKASPDYFSGTTWVKSLVTANDGFNTIISNVVFEAGARNNWHTHPNGQILIVTDGVGYYQEKGKDILVIQKGDVIKIPADVIHWHGASHDSSLTHIVINPNIQKGIVQWMDRVTDEEYNRFK